MFNNWFTIITGIATLISLVLQIKPIFPKYNSIISKSLYILIGLFIGSIIGGIKIEKIVIDLGDNLLKNVVILVQISCITIALYLFLRQAHSKGTEDHSGALAGLISVFFVLFLYHVFSSAPIADRDSEKITLSEWNQLAKTAEENKQYDRAIWLYQKIEYKVYDTDIRAKIDSKLKELKEKSLGIQ